ncbi:Rieske 2Fe-2S domain-containing protein [Aetokthonos hydrillicola Thurmond2011]|jgi:phenylpropionate dioxygenase-like ring-hydroxylating dioxygenase large terminal subunit|uniref:Rieske 2Fe-2S domain-containing protein n=1 Tax=Aetokthonos hydrillicola Thurmond2011 TaxID=2712845 RepID=A0AAP5IFX8_9CYAN|nr:Rieske 2Fe-2S domain-containing protein [Aetokthonos hydrillicola]MBO3461707.1 Rieske 2Fe-2S domain-containing protein [Aetokthonos hydrillicola CCALA 1050]MBW4589987.1 Rieske 2Fe-2S domain-containing protein [Aetokthonos hydrillicola CCALA 1050]MDR9900569.1 Rieske 2Fe-2S domain-containing protein [Aetokthonos hydrillicola Thurmond2011]
MSWNLPGAPWLIAHKSMLSVNKPKLFTICGEDYVLWKNEKGEISALENICPHLGAKLSNGWICPNSNTIACPYHALEFDSQGRTIVANEKISKPLAKPLELFLQGDFIWTYANKEAKIPIPTILEEVLNQYRFVGVAGDISIKAPFLYALEINHDYNHAKATHRDLFKFKDIKIDKFRDDGYSSVVDLSQIREDNTLAEYIKNPLLLTYPKRVKAMSKNYFPSLVAFYSESPLGTVCDVFVIYPETETTTRTFMLVFAERSLGVLNWIINPLLLSAANEIIKQDAAVVENLYPRFQPKIRLENEEPWNWVRELYLNWSFE